MTKTSPENLGVLQHPLTSTCLRPSSSASTLPSKLLSHLSNVLHHLESEASTSCIGFWWWSNQSLSGSLGLIIVHCKSQTKETIPDRKWNSRLTSIHNSWKYPESDLKRKLLNSEKCWCFDYCANISIFHIVDFLFDVQYSSDKDCSFSIIVRWNSNSFESTCKNNKELHKTKNKGVEDS